jgi:alpha-tubulin suppressor-like RCC1 family protein
LCVIGALAHACGARTPVDECPADIPVLSPESSVIGLSVGTGSACALLRSGRVACWGHDAYGNTVLPPRLVEGAVVVVALSGGAGQQCALTAHGELRCWGSNWAGQLGDGSPTEQPGGHVYERRDDARPVPGLLDVVDVSAGYAHTCAVDARGAAWCWGAGGERTRTFDDPEGVRGRLGDGTDLDRPTPVRVVGIDDAVRIAAGSGHSCALRGEGSVMCWGDNRYGQLGNGTLVTSLVPVPVAGLSGAVEVTAGAGSTCARLGSGQVRCWGWDDSGDRVAPGPVPGLGDHVLSVEAGGSHNCAIECGGRLKCWGENDVGQLGDGTHGSIGADHDRAVAADVVGVEDVIAVSAGRWSTCALQAGGEVLCWGWNESGTLGVEGHEVSPVPVRVEGLP